MFDFSLSLPVWNLSGCLDLARSARQATSLREQVVKELVVANPTLTRGTLLQLLSIFDQASWWLHYRDDARRCLQRLLDLRSIERHGK